MVIHQRESSTEFFGQTAGFRSRCTIPERCALSNGCCSCEIARAALKSLLQLFVGTEMLRKNLDGHWALQPGIASAIHFTHATNGTPSGHKVGALRDPLSCRPWFARVTGIVLLAWGAAMLAA